MSNVDCIRHFYRCQRDIVWKQHRHQRAQTRVSSSKSSTPSSRFGIPNKRSQTRLFLSSSGDQSVKHANKKCAPNSHFYNHKALRKVRLKGEIRPLLSLAIQDFLMDKQRQATATTSSSSSSYLRDPLHGPIYMNGAEPGDTLVSTNKSTNNEPDISPAVTMLAQWNGYERIDPSRIVVTRYFSQAGRLPLGQGLVAEANPFASENYIVFARPRQRKIKKHGKSTFQEEHPPFAEEDASWYRHLEGRVNDNLNHWEGLARKRRQQSLSNVKQGLLRTVDAIQVPVANAFQAITIRLGPIMDKCRAVVKRNMMRISKQTHKKIDSVLEPTAPSEEDCSEEEVSMENDNEFEGALMVKEDACNEFEPEDLIIQTKDGSSLILLNNVHPSHRLLSLPVNLSYTSSGRAGRKSQPYQIRLARGGLVITASFIFLGALAPAYRSLKFISIHPSTAKVVMVTLVGSMAYSAWSFLNGAKTRQRELIAAAIQSRLVARDDAALAFLKNGAVVRLTEVLMEEYVSQLLKGERTYQSKNMDPVVKEIACSVGLFKDPMQSRFRIAQQLQIETEKSDGATGGPIFVVEWEEARENLVHVLAKRR